MDRKLEVLEKTADFYIRMMIVAVTLVNLTMWAADAQNPPQSQLVFSIFALLFVIAMVVTGITSIIRAKRK